MIDGVDSSKNHVGDVFHASLETDLYANNTLVARKGTDIYGRLANAQEAGHLSGSAELQLELIRIVIGGRDYPLVSSDYGLKGKGRGRRWSHHRRHCRRRKRRSDWSRGGIRGRRWRAGVHARTASESAQRNFVGVPAAATGRRYASTGLRFQAFHYLWAGNGPLMRARGRVGEACRATRGALSNWKHGPQILPCFSYC
jgi:hypothetical protein